MAVAAHATTLTCATYTPHHDLLNVGSAGPKAELEARNVLFMEDSRDKYLNKLFEKIGAWVMSQGR